MNESKEDDLFRRYYVGFHMLYELYPNVCRLYFPILGSALVALLTGGLQLSGAMVPSGWSFVTNGVLQSMCAIGGIVMQAHLRKIARDTVFQPDEHVVDPRSP